MPVLTSSSISNMKANLAILLNNKQVRKFFWANGIILLFFAIVAVWKWSYLPPQLPLFYSLPRSGDQLATPAKLLILPLFAIIFSVINFYLASIFYTKERLAAIILIVMATSASFLLLITFIKIVLLVA